MAIIVHVENLAGEQRTFPLPSQDQLQTWVNAAAERDGDAELSIRLVDEVEGQVLNQQYRNKDKATNVLSFPADLPEELPAEVRDSLLGDLVICLPVVARESEEQGKAFADHLAHLVIHGTLHLIGWDHQEETAARTMEAQEIALLARFGIGNPYEL